LKTSIQFLPIWMTIFIIAIVGKPIYSQQFTESLKALLTISEKNKLLEAEAIEFKGKSILQTVFSQDSNEPKPSANSKPGVSAKIRELDAIVFFAFSNELKFKTFNSAITNFHSSYKGNPGDLDKLEKIENNIYDSIIWVNDFRRSSDREKTIIEKSPLLIKAGNIEARAILRMEKLLYIYLKLPETFDINWINTNDLSDPYDKNPGNVHANSANNISRDTDYQAQLSKALKIYNILDISESQLEYFNEFLTSRFPLPDNGIDFMKVAYSNIDSLKNLWEVFLYGGGKASDSTSVDLLSKISLSNRAGAERHDLLSSHSNSAFKYKIQIFASKVKMSNQFLQNAYKGKEKLDENLENGWYKYTIGNYKSYKEAKTARDHLGIETAFIVAYLNEKRIELSTYSRFPANKPVITPIKHEIGVK